MFKIKYVASAVLAGILLVGCGNGISDAALEATGLKGAPNWVIQGGDGLYTAVGDAPIVKNNVNFARAEALASARVEVAKQIQVRVNSYLQKTTQRRDESLTEDVKNGINEAAQQDLVDSKPSAFWISDDGKRVYVLVRLSEEAVGEIRKKLKEQKIDVVDLEQSVQNNSGK